MQNFRTAKAAAYITNISMSAVATISPLLFSTFYTHYGISYSLLGLLVLVNFCTQLAIDLIFSFYSHKFNLKLTIRIMPVLTAVGFAVYATLPMLFPQAAYWGLVAGTMIFALSGGLAEVLISPLIAAMPSEHPEREMSKLHSVYAWGVVAIVLASSGILYLIGKENWYWLALGLTAIPVVAAGLFFFAPMPEMETPQKTSGAVKLFTDKSLILCILCIFFGGASENIMSQWCSGYLEQALGIAREKPLDSDWEYDRITLTDSSFFSDGLRYSFVRLKFPPGTRILARNSREIPIVAELSYGQGKVLLCTVPLGQDISGSSLIGAWAHILRNEVKKHLPVSFESRNILEVAVNRKENGGLTLALFNSTGEAWRGELRFREVVSSVCEVFPAESALALEKDRIRESVEPYSVKILTVEKAKA